MTASYHNLMDMLESAAQNHPEKTAFIFLADGESQEIKITFSELAMKAKSVSAMLQKHLIAQHEQECAERVLLVYEPGLDFIIGFFGCIYAGVIAIPVVPPINKAFVEKLQRIIEDAKPRFCLSTQKIKKKIQQLQMAKWVDANPLIRGIANKFADAVMQKARDSSGWDFDKLIWLTSDKLPSGSAQSWQLPKLGTDDLAFLQYTSGSTGQPKGVMLTHGNLLHNLNASHHHFGIQQSDCSVCWVPPYHNMGLVGGILQGIFSHCLVVLLSPVHFLENPMRWLQAISRYRANCTGVPGFAFEFLLKKFKSQDENRLDLSSLRFILVGGEPAQAGVLERFTEVLSEYNLKDTAISPGYGLTEHTLLVTRTMSEQRFVVKELDSEALAHRRMSDKGKATQTHNEASSKLLRRLVGNGISDETQQLKIIDVENRQALSDDEVGEVWIKGPSVAKGYWNKSELTQEVFHAYLKNGEGPFLKTGDFGFLKDEQLFITGRIKDLIIIRGKNYYPQDIEESIKQSYLALMQTAVVVVFSIDIEEKEAIVVVLEMEGKLTVAQEQAIVSDIQEVVSKEYGLQVYSINVVPNSTLEKTTSGKIMRYAARARYLSHELHVTFEWRYESDAQKLFMELDSSQILKEELKSIRPSEFTQASISQWLMSWLLAHKKIEEGSFDLEKSFYAYGLDSLDVVQLTNHLSSWMDFLVPSSALFDYQTPGKLSQYLAVQAQHPSNDMQQGLVFSDWVKNGSDSFLNSTSMSAFPASFGQERMYFLYQLLADKSVYNISIMLGLKGKLNKQALNEGLNILIERHPSLRTFFKGSDTGVMQYIQPHIETALKVITVEDSQRTISLDQALTNEIVLAFDLEQAPLYRVTLFEKSREESILLWVFHHSIVDGASFGVLMRELAVLYNGNVSKQSIMLPDACARYVEYAGWQRAWLTTEAAKRQIEFWKMQLHDTPERLKLPTKNSRTNVISQKGHNYYFEISASSTSKLKRLSQQANVSLFATMFVSFAILLHRYSGQEDIMIGTPVLGRYHAELEQLVGFFVNTVAIRSTVDFDNAFFDILQKMGSKIQTILINAELPYDQVIKNITLKSSQSYIDPLFQVMFTGL